MKRIIYYLVLLIFIALLSGFLIQQQPDGMNMKQILSVSVLLVMYVVAISLVGEGKTADEREAHHRYLSNRGGLIAGTIVLSTGILFQLFNHRLDFWLLASLISINLVKIIVLIYADRRK